MKMLFLIFILAFALADRAQAQADCNAKDAPQDIRTDAFKINLMAADFKCQRLKRGQSATVDWPGVTSPTRVTHAYRLTKTGPKSFKSEFRLSLFPTEGDNISDAAMQKFKDKIAYCLRENFQKVPGPNGEKLTFELSDDPDVPASIVEVSAKLPREDSMHYSIKSNCPVILHEILHLHGLVDEYKETTIGAKFDPQTGTTTYTKQATGNEAIAYDCRHLGEEDSIMNNSFEAAVNSREWVQWSYEVCDNGGKPGCPAGAKREKRFVNIEPGSILGSTDDGLIQGTQKLVKKIPRLKKSLLDPAQFLSITRPGCMEENKLYYACSANAYVSSIDSTIPSLPMGSIMSGGDTPAKPGTVGRKSGMGKAPLINAHANSACQPTPPECKNPKAWSGDQ